MMTPFAKKAAVGAVLGFEVVASILFGIEARERVAGDIRESAGKVEESLGASFQLPGAVAFFETSLASSISSSATSMTLVSAADAAGTALASSTYAFVIDEGTASEEMVIADCTGTACTNMQRGLSVVTGTTTVAALQKSHRRGASVKITDGPVLLIINRIFRGQMGIEVPIQYATSVSTTTIGSRTNNVASVGFVTDTAFGSTPVAVNAGGTGATTFTANTFLVGNGTSPITSTTSPHVTRLTIQDGNATSTFGTPINFIHTGTSTFSGKMVFSSTPTFDGSQMTWRGQTITLPSALGVANSVFTLTDPSTGATAWQKSSGLVTSTTSQTVISNSAAEYVLLSYAVPGDSLGTGGVLEAEIPFHTFGCGAVSSIVITAYYGATSTNSGFAQATSTCPDTGASAAQLLAGRIKATLVANGATNSQRGSIELTALGGLSQATAKTYGLSSTSTPAVAVDSTAAQPFTVTFQFLVNNAQNTLTKTMGYLELVR